VIRKAILPLLLALVACSRGGEAQEQQRTAKPPTLQNREAFIAERDALGARLLPPGDSVTIRVFVFIDENGRVHQPEVRQELDARLIDAAIALVRKMHFNPAIADGKPTGVLLTIPVRLRNDGH
jgi:hypothetical protein